MLKVHLLNVGQGDSIVLEHYKDDERHFGIIDSNSTSHSVAAGLTKLRALGAESLSFVALTHPHADHYTGLGEVLRAFAGRVGALFTFPLEKNRNRLTRLAQRYAEAARASDSQQVKFKAAQLIEVLHYASNNDAVWESPVGIFGAMPLNGFAGVSVSQVLPHAAVKGKLYDELDRGVLKIEDPLSNELCLAMRVEYRGHSILLGADGLAKNWLYQAARSSLTSRSFRSNVVKLPHHGSGDDCSDKVLDALFDSPDSENEQIALISAAGGSHPSLSVLKSLQSRGIKPYCTNLSKHCGGGKVRTMVPDDGLTPALNRFLNSTAIEASRNRIAPCQGDVTVAIDDLGQLTVDRQFGNSCAFRGEFAGIVG